MTPTATRASGKPRTRQRVQKEPPALKVPDIDENAAERKRILNVLAQRRYRERKRLGRSKADPDDRPLETVVTSEAVADWSMPGPSPSLSQSSTDGGVALKELELVNWDSFGGSDLSSLLPETSSSLEDFLSGDQSTVNNNLSLQTLSDSSIAGAFGPGTGSPLTGTNSSSGSSADFNFPDSYLLPVHELTILKAMIRISQRIGCESSTLWSLECLSPFNQGLGTPPDQLPAAWRPTPSQMTVPHHPVIDFLPWPSARDRILMFMGLPDTARPPVAQGPMMLVNFVYDLEDNAEGIRVYGADPCDPGSWEVGQLFFERWWFLFDRAIIDTSNRWRELRGAPPLQLKGP